jgi:hypothetical protein
VTGVTPVVDVQNVRQQTVFRKAEQEALPVGRAIGKWAAVIPALTLTNASEQDVGGNSTKGNYVGAHGIVGSVTMGMFLDGMTFKSIAVDERADREPGRTRGDRDADVGAVTA